MDFSDDILQTIKDLGQRLKSERLRRNETQRIFATRIGVSIPTLHKMENGDKGVQIGYWVNALEILGRIKEIDSLLCPPENLFEKYQQTKEPIRKRASNRKRT